MKNLLYLPDISHPGFVERKATREGYGEALVELGMKNKDVWVLTADLRESMRVGAFAKQFPDRFIECGVSEQNMMGVAAGLALSGKIPFVSSFGVFSPGRNWDQLRVSVCYSKANVKIAGGHTGLSTGPDGATHQALEDIAITRTLPNMTVVVPCDAIQAKKATLASSLHEKAVYIRLSREPMPIMTSEHTPFRIGKAQVMQEGSDVTIIASGPILYEAFVAREMLENYRVSVELINLHTIKPIDKEAIVKSAKKTKHVITCEDHQILGGVGSAVAEVLSQEFPVPIEMIGVKDQFGQSASARELWNHYGLTSKFIIQAVKKVLSIKN